MENILTLCKQNLDYFEKDKSVDGVKMYLNFKKIIELVQESKFNVKTIETFAGDFDFDENTPGNGYRSYNVIFNAALKHTEKTCTYIADNCRKFFFRKSVNAK